MIQTDGTNIASGATSQGHIGEEGSQVNSNSGTWGARRFSFNIHKNEEGVSSSGTADSDPITFKKNPAAFLKMKLMSWKKTVTKSKGKTAVVSIHLSSNQMLLDSADQRVRRSSTLVAAAAPNTSSSNTMAKRTDSSVSTEIAASRQTRGGSRGSVEENEESKGQEEVSYIDLVGSVAASDDVEGDREQVRRMSKSLSRTALSFRVDLSAARRGAVVLEGADKIRHQSLSTRGDIQIRFFSESGESTLKDFIVEKRAEYSKDLDSGKLSYGFPNTILGGKEEPFGIYLGAYPAVKVSYLDDATQDPIIRGRKGPVTSFVKICERSNRVWASDQRSYLEANGYTFYDFAGKETHGIEHFRNACSSLPPEELDADVELWFDKLFIPFDDALLKGKHVWVHCVNGQERSPALLMFWLINRFDLSYEEAYEFLQVCRPGLRPIFPDAIKKYAAALREKRASS